MKNKRVINTGLLLRNKCLREMLTGGSPSQRRACFLCGVQGCTKRCKSKSGLTIHERRMHERARKEFKCNKCQKSFPAETNWINNEKAYGVPPQRQDLRCDTCGESFSKNNIARHSRTCKQERAWPGEGRRQWRREGRPFEELECTSPR